ncbi:MAG: alpha-1,6-mannosyltransferase [Roseivirga sp.]|jgi:alpha-1,6-mannosyltransferase
MLNKNSPWVNLAYILTGGLTIYIGYFVARENTWLLLSLYTLLFASVVVIIRNTSTEEVDLGYYWGVLLRVLLIASLPKLSDDVYRFIWDGRLLLNFEDPYKYLPAHHLGQGLTGITQGLYDQLNSPDYFTVYPPLNQVIFFISTLFSPGSIAWSVVILRVIMIVFELGNISLIRKLLRHYKLPQAYGLIYVLNPLVLFEVTGNLHFEGIMVYFLLMAIWQYEQGKLHKSAIFFGLSVATKFLPLIFLPLLLRKIGFKKTMIYGLIVGATLSVTFLPLINTAHIWAIKDSIELYFQKFEFNGSIYYLARWYGFETAGHNIIAKSGKWMMYATMATIFLYSLISKKKDWPRQMVWVWTLYLLFATTVHPWYIITLLAVAVFSKVRFPFLWSYLIFLTYANYLGGEYTDRIEVVIVEYSLVGLIALWEVFGGSSEKLFFGEKAT